MHETQPVVYSVKVQVDFPEFFLGSSGLREEQIATTRLPAYSLSTRSANLGLFAKAQNKCAISSQMWKAAIWKQFVKTSRSFPRCHVVKSRHEMNNRSSSQLAEWERFVS